MEGQRNGKVLESKSSERQTELKKKFTTQNSAEFGLVNLKWKKICGNIIEEWPAELVFWIEHSTQAQSTAKTKGFHSSLYTKRRNVEVAEA